MAPHAWFEPVLEWYTPPSDLSHGTYFGLARRGDAGDRCGYLAVQDFHGEFRECEFPLEELEELEKTLKVISLPLRSSLGTPDRGSGLIRIYTVTKAGSTFSTAVSTNRNGIRFWLSSTKRPNGFCRPLRLRCSRISSMIRQRITSREPMEQKRPLRRQPDDHNFGSLLMLSVTAGAFLLVTWVAAKALFLLLQEAPIP